MPARQVNALLAVLAVCVLAGCAAGAGADTTSPTAMPTPTATPIPTPTPNPVATATPEPASAAQIVALAQQFWPTAPSSNALNPCAIPDCPITPRLATRADELVKIESVYKTGSVDIWCRCQQYIDVKITAEVTPAGGTAHVASGSLKMDFIMVLQDGKLLLDDTQCTGGGPSTSIYTSQGLNPCEAIES